MARINSYAQDGAVNGSDKILGTDVTSSDTKNFTVNSIIEYMVENVVTVQGLSLNELKFVSPNGTTYSLLMSDTGQLLTFLGVTNAPFIEALPVINGTANVGSTLTAVAANATGLPEPVITWQWQRQVAGSDWDNILGETSTSYTPTVDDFGAFLRVQQIATNILGTVSATSVSTAAIGGNLLEIYYLDPLIARMDTVENNQCILDALAALEQIEVV